MFNIRDCGLFLEVFLLHNIMSVGFSLHGLGSLKLLLHVVQS